MREARRREKEREREITHSFFSFFLSKRRARSIVGRHRVG